MKGARVVKSNEDKSAIESVKERRELVKSVKSCKAMYLRKDESEVPGPSSGDIHEKTPRLIRLVKSIDESEKRKEMIKDDKKKCGTYLDEDEFPQSRSSLKEVQPKMSKKGGPLESGVGPEKEKEELVKRITEEVLRQLNLKERKKIEPCGERMEVQECSPLPRREPRIRVKSNVQLIPPRDNAPTPRPSQAPDTPGSIGMSGEEVGDTNSEWSVARKEVEERKKRGEIPRTFV